MFAQLASYASGLVRSDSPDLSYMARPFEQLASTLHNGDMREEGVPYHMHMRRMAERFTKLVDEHAADDLTGLVQALYAVIYLHDADETLKKRKLDVEWRYALDTVIESPKMLQYVNKSLDLFSSNYAGNVQGMIAQVGESEHELGIIVNLVKPLDIHDNSATVRRYAGEEKTLERIRKVRDYARYLPEVHDRIAGNPYHELIERSGLCSLVRRTRRNLRRVERGYQRQLLQHRSDRKAKIYIPKSLRFDA